MKKLAKKLTLSRESLRCLDTAGLGEAKGAGRTANPTCVGYTCLDSCATCYATCVTCGASCTC
ncbi:MAG TPA: hypothetical protein VGH73_07525 [Thermoanaerobaculia bacterium]|jgi:hypothetical protein